MKKKIIIEFSWWNNDRTGIPVDHHEQLEESATDRIKEMMAENYTSGQLLETVYGDDEDEFEYEGSWSVSTETL
ncbi:MAG: hypothetical protein ACTSX1_12470 [Candidatus Heimdallarchaeaceae archaeon]